MNNYLKADLARIRSKQSHIICLLVIYLILAAITFFKSSNEASWIEFADLAAGSLPVYLGTIVFFAVFSDDIKTRTMQVAIGRGLTRSKVIIAKILEGLILTVVYFALAGVLMQAVGMLAHVSLSSASTAKLWSAIIESIFQMMFYFNLGMILVAATLKSNLAEIFYILCAFDIIPGAVNILFAFCYEKLGWPNLLPYLYSGLISDFMGHPLEKLLSLVGALVYLIVTVWLTMQIFSKKELEF